MSARMGARHLLTSRERGRRWWRRGRPWLFLFSLLASACTGGGAERPPRELVLAVDVCEYCHMAVDDPTRAAQWIPASGPIVTFDEPGCLVAWLQENPQREGRGYVADAVAGEWVPVEDASYLLHGIRTGMGFDIVAFADPSAAAERPGEVVSWQGLIERGVRDAHEH